jgi:hypothetical protein
MTRPGARLPPALLLAALSLALLPGCRDWRSRVDPARAAAEPEQLPVDGTPVLLERKGHEVRLTPRTTYRITGYAVETSRHLLDDWDFVLPMDLALAWGPVADPAVLAHMKFHLSGRYVSWWHDGRGAPPDLQALRTHVANHHLVPATPEVERELGRIRVGDLVTLRGRLVDVEIADRAGRVVHRSATSLSRDDVGSGACEQLLVESVDVERP